MSVEQPPLKSGVSHSDAMVSDLRVTLRGFAAAPWFAVTVAATLALGIGAATAVFSVVYAVLWRPLPFAQVDRVLMLGEFSAASESRLVAPVTFDDWRTRQTAFSEIAAFRYWETVNLEDQMADPEPVTLTTGTDNLFRALGGLRSSAAPTGKSRTRTAAVRPSSVTSSGNAAIAAIPRLSAASSASAGLRP
jgi:hypothetical protein